MNPFRWMVEKTIKATWKKKYGKDLPFDIKNIDLIMKNMHRNMSMDYSNHFMLQELCKRHLSTVELNNALRAGVLEANAQRAFYTQIMDQIIQTLILVAGDKIEIPEIPTDTEIPDEPSN